MMSRAIVVLAVLLLIAASPHDTAAQLDLSGFWQDEYGTPYRLRQIGPDVYWYMDGAPRAVNVFVGRIAGNTIIGTWADLPGGELRNSGQLSLRIDSNDRLVKTGESQSYGGSVFTRRGASVASTPPVLATPPPVVSAPPPTTSQTIGASWGTKADNYRGRNGERVTYACPPNGGFNSVWGTDVYTDDSSICTAAVHAGLISVAGGGVVTIEIRPGQPSYTGSARNGASTSNYGGWNGSYVFVGGSGAGSVPSVPSGPAIAADWGMNPSNYRGQIGRRFVYTCPPTGTPGHRLYGTDVYTDDSSVCTAAVHVGAISFSSGGTVTIEIRPGQGSYQPSARNGVSSSGWGSWDGSFVLVNVPLQQHMAAASSAPTPTAQQSQYRQVSLQSLNFPDRYVRHANFLGELTPVSSDLDRKDSTFMMVPGLAGNATVAFESVNYPGFYLRHQDFRIKLHKNDGTALFAMDASFRQVPALADASLSSFQSVNFPDRYLRHRDFRLYLESGSDELFRKDASFRVRE